MPTPLIAGSAAALSLLLVGCAGPGTAPVTDDGREPDVLVESVAPLSDGTDGCPAGVEDGFNSGWFEIKEWLSLDEALGNHIAADVPLIRDACWGREMVGTHFAGLFGGVPEDLEALDTELTSLGYEATVIDADGGVSWDWLRPKAEGLDRISGKCYDDDQHTDESLLNQYGTGPELFTPQFCYLRVTYV